MQGQGKVTNIYLAFFVWLMMGVTAVGLGAIMTHVTLDAAPYTETDMFLNVFYVSIAMLPLIFGMSRYMRHLELKRPIDLPKKEVTPKEAAAVCGGFALFWVLSVLIFGANILLPFSGYEMTESQIVDKKWQQRKTNNFYFLLLDGAPYGEDKPVEVSVKKSLYMCLQGGDRVSVPYKQSLFGGALFHGFYEITQIDYGVRHPDCS